MAIDFESMSDDALRQWIKLTNQVLNDPVAKSDPSPEGRATRIYCRETAVMAADVLDMRDQEGKVEEVEWSPEHIGRNEC